MNSTQHDIRNPVLLCQAGIAALQKELGAVGAVSFLLQFWIGHGDYTTERHQFLDSITMDDLLRDAEEREKIKAR